MTEIRDIQPEWKYWKNRRPPLDIRGPKDWLDDQRHEG
jgi:hypothetical protein